VSREEQRARPLAHGRALVAAGLGTLAWAARALAGRVVDGITATVGDDDRIHHASDFGDGWEHDIVLRNLPERAPAHPKAVEALGATPTLRAAIWELLPGGDTLLTIEPAARTQP
jgi:hypothetical protein